MNIPAPLLLILVHTEEEFDWDAGFSRTNTAVTHVQGLSALHEQCARKGFKPTYFCSYPVAANAEAVATLQSMISDGSGEIGAHLHPWVCPPFDEEVSVFNSYPGNLPEELERSKLAHLTERISVAFDRAPVAYLAGRYGFGPHTARILADLGYLVDCSIAPGWDDSAAGGPNFADVGPEVFWDRQVLTLLRIPHTNGYAGFLCRGGRRLVRPDQLPFSNALRIPGIASRIGGVMRAKLSLEDSDPALMRKLTQALFAAGQRVFTLSYHSPSAALGHTPYVRTPADLTRLNKVLSDFLDFFTSELGGTGATASEAHAFFSQHGLA